MAYIKISGIVLGVLTKIPRLPMQNFSELQGKLEEELGESSPQDSKPDKKAKVASITVTSSTATELSKFG